MIKVRIAAGVGILGPLVAVAVSLIVGLLSPTYDPIQSSVSRLAAVGAPKAVLMDSAIAFLGLSLLALALGMWRAKRFAPPAVGLVTLAGISFLVAAVVRIDPAVPMTVVGHRAASGIALFSLVLAPLVTSSWRVEDQTGATYRRASKLIGLIAIGGMIAGAGLLVEGFPGGLWERAMAALTLGWVELTAVRLLDEGVTLAPR